MASKERAQEELKATARKVAREKIMGELREPLSKLGEKRAELKRLRAKLDELKKVTGKLSAAPSKE
ncbi:MAG TPA: hypothetical protein VGB76_16100 [Pyrinomonadaceae bacterium]|jgi:hypothetical protein